MTQKVIVFAGTKQSHKSTSAKYITASRMKKAGFLKSFEIDNEGDLIVSSTVKNDDGTFSEGRGVLDLKRSDDDYVKYAYEKIWPLAKIYSFADRLKQSCVEIFSLNPQYIYGTDQDKNRPTHIQWDRIWNFLPDSRKDEIIAKYRHNVKSNFITHRELLQEFGTICRTLDEDCWVKSCWSLIDEEGWPFVIIDDCRYENEVDYCNSRDAKVVLLTHQPFKDDTHKSEQIHTVDRKKFSYILDNKDMSFEEKNNELEKILVQFGWTTGEIT